MKHTAISGRAEEAVVEAKSDRSGTGSVETVKIVISSFEKGLSYMRSSVLVKRVLPFILALSAGLFVASFFVDIMPRFNVRDHRIERCRQLQQLRIENSDLRRQNQDLRDENEILRRSNPMSLKHIPRGEWNTSRFEVPPPPPASRFVR